METHRYLSADRIQPPEVIMEVLLPVQERSRTSDNERLESVHPSTADG